MSSEPIFLTHGKAQLALHELREAPADVETHPLLLLHGLGERAPERCPELVAAWPGAVHALDFTGHGRSTIPAGGGYTAEILMADADIALSHLGTCTVLGRGLGAYVALLVAGGRPEAVRGAILTDGPGLVGGGVRPATAYISPSPPSAMGPPDPLALAEMSRDVRPPDYVVEYVRLAVTHSSLEQPIAVCTVVRPEWLVRVVEQPGVADTNVDDALDLYRAAPT